MTPRQLEAFREAVLHGSLTASALTLDISQPAVSRMMKDLEKEVGFVLFERRLGRMQPTGEALMLYEEVERSFVGMEKVRKTASQIKKRQSGRLRLAAMPALGASFLPKITNQFLLSEQDISLALEVHSSKVIVDLVQEQQVELGFVDAEITPMYSSVRRALKFQVPCVCGFHSGHRFAEQEHVSIADLQGESLIELLPRSQIPRKIATLCNVQNISVGHRFQASWCQTACQFVAAGHGITIVDLISAQNFEHPDFLYRPLRQDLTYNIELIYPPIQAPNELVERFISLFCSWLPGDVEVIELQD